MPDRAARAVTAGLPAPKRFELWDLRQLAVLAALTPVAWLIPPRWWERATRAVAHGFARATPRYAAARRAMFPPDHLDRLGMSSGEAFLHHQTLGFLETVRTLRTHAPLGWDPPVRLRGAEHLDAAIARGHGAILWHAGLAPSDLLTKRTLAQHGYAVSHLSRPGAGYSRSAFGRRVLNPIRTRAERRYLAERVPIGDGAASPGALRALRRRLDENRIVTITLILNPWPEHAAQWVETDLLGTRVRIPTGPVTLARSSGAALLPVFGAEAEDGTFEVVIEPELPADLPERGEALRESAERLTALLGRYVERYPAQWTDWHHLTRPWPGRSETLSRPRPRGRR